MMDRRDFMKYAGLSGLSLASIPLLKKLSAAELPQGSSHATKQLAMVVNLRKCLELDNCTKCIEACNQTHNIPLIDNPDDNIRWIWKERFDRAFEDQEHEHLTESIRWSPLVVMCNHCENPPCVRVCPTQATWKREKDGIVMMDWHRCIGCRYCMAACPYGSRSFNWRDPRQHLAKIQPDYPTRTKGVVEKCTFCDERLSRGQLPSCVEACSEKALTFGDLSDHKSEVRELLSSAYTIRRKPSLGTGPQVYYIV
jgi:molybdopterin-containing oxidoreductase family iron-sulfur binding subunit